MPKIGDPSARLSPRQQRARPTPTVDYSNPSTRTAYAAAPPAAQSPQPAAAQAASRLPRLRAGTAPAGLRPPRLRAAAAAQATAPAAGRPPTDRLRGSVRPSRAAGSCLRLSGPCWSAECSPSLLFWLSGNWSEGIPADYFFFLSFKRGRCEYTTSLDTRYSSHHVYLTMFLAILV